MRKKISIDELSQKSSEQIIDDMSNARYSLLSSLGCGSIIARFFWVRYACLFFMNMAARKAKRKRYHSLKPNIALKTALAIIFARGAPSAIQPSFPRPSCGFVIGFNHPSLGEIIRLMGVCMSNYPTHKYLFPEGASQTSHEGVWRNLSREVRRVYCREEHRSGRTKREAEAISLR